MLDSVKKLLEVQMLDVRIRDVLEHAEAVPRDLIHKRQAVAAAEERLAHVDGDRLVLVVAELDLEGLADLVVPRQLEGRAGALANDVEGAARVDADDFVAR